MSVEAPTQSTVVSAAQAERAAAAPIAISAVNVSKMFRQGNQVISAVRNLSLTARQGEFVAVMGASGSGKSTLLHLLAGLTRPDGGTISVGGRDLAAMSDRELTRCRRENIGLVFQAFNLISTLTVEDNILLPLQSAGRSNDARERLEELYTDLEIGECRRRYPDTLSGGQQQRVAIARALVGSPAVVLADEPTGSLDSVTGQNLCGLLRRLNEKDGHTIVLVTHEPAVAMWSDRIVVLKDGAINSEFATSDFDDARHLAGHYFDLNSSAAVGAAT